MFEHLEASQVAEWVATNYADDNGTTTATKGAVLSDNLTRLLHSGTDSAPQPYHYRCVTSATN